MVKVKFFTLLALDTGVRTYETSASDVKALLGEIRDRYGDKAGDLSETCIVLLNGINIGYLDGADTILKDGDVISLFPPVAGG